MTLRVNFGFDYHMGTAGFMIKREKMIKSQEKPGLFPVYIEESKATSVKKSSSFIIVFVKMQKIQNFPFSR